MKVSCYISKLWFLGVLWCYLHRSVRILWNLLHPPCTMYLANPSGRD